MPFVGIKEPPNPPDGMQWCNNCIRRYRLTPIPIGEYRNCQSCRQKILATHNRRKISLITAGICRYCGRNPATNKTVCFVCAKLLQADAKRKREEMNKIGMCQICQTRPTEGGKKRCQHCSKKYNASNLEFTRKAVAAGLCSTCHKVPSLKFEGKSIVQCESCVLKTLSSRHFKTNIFAAELKRKFESQGRRCPYTGRALKIGFNTSIDHIFPKSRFPEKQYELDNIEFVLSSVNMMKQNLTKEEFLRFITEIGMNLDLLSEEKNKAPLAHVINGRFGLVQ